MEAHCTAHCLSQKHTDSLTHANGLIMLSPMRRQRWPHALECRMLRPISKHWHPPSQACACTRCLENIEGRPEADRLSRCWHSSRVHSVAHGYVGDVPFQRVPRQTTDYLQAVINCIQSAEQHCKHSCAQPGQTQSEILLMMTSSGTQASCLPVEIVLLSPCQ